MRITPARTRAPVPRHIRLLLGARAVNQLGAFSLAFLTVMLCRAFGASYATAGAISAAFGLATIPSRLLGGRLADRLGRRRTILTGMAGCAAAQLGLAASPDLAVAAGCALLLGLAFELYEPPSQAMIADATPPEQRASAFGLLTTALAVGNMAAGLIAVVVGRSNLRWLFVADAATCLGCALIVCLGLPADHQASSRVASRPPGGDRSAVGAVGAAAAAERGPARLRVRGPSARCDPASPWRDPASPWRDPASPWRDRALLAMTATGTVFALVYMTILVALPLSLTADDLNPASAGLVMAAATLSLVLGRPVLRARPLAGLSGPMACAGGFLLMALGLAGYAMAHSVVALMTPTAAWSIGNMLLTGRALAVISGLAPPNATARYLAVYGLRWGVATVAAPLLATFLIASVGPAGLWAAGSVLCLLMAAVEPWLLHAIAGRRTDCAPALTRA
jgi:MFS family permease